MRCTPFDRETDREKGHVHGISEVFFFLGEGGLFDANSENRENGLSDGEGKNKFAAAARIEKGGRVSLLTRRKTPLQWEGQCCKKKRRELCCARSGKGEKKVVAKQVIQSF